MANHGYKKYMKQDTRKDHPLMKIFIVSFFGMLLLSTLLINSVAKKMSVDTSIGDYKEQQSDELEDKKFLDNRLEMIQNEDQGRNFSDLMKTAEDTTKNKPAEDESDTLQTIQEKSTDDDTVSQHTVYKVFIGTYSTAEQAKVAKEIIQESGSTLSPIVKCLGANNYTLQVGIFKNKQSAEGLLTTIQKNNLPGRIVQEN